MSNLDDKYVRAGGFKPPLTEKELTKNMQYWLKQLEADEGIESVMKNARLMTVATIVTYLCEASAKAKRHTMNTTGKAQNNAAFDKYVALSLMGEVANAIDKYTRGELIIE